MRAAIYCRVSTKDKGQSCDMQLNALKPFILARGWELVGIYSDTISGTKDSRPALDRLMADARSRKIDCVCVWRFDRFARSSKHLMLSLEEFNSLGVQFVSLTEQLDTTSSMGKAMFTILAAFSQLERDIIAERVRTKVQQLIAGGKVWGRPLKTFRRDQALVDLQAGMSLRATAKKYGVSHSTISRLQSPSSNSRNWVHDKPST